MAEFGSQQEKIERDYDVRVRKYLKDVNEGKLSLDNVPTTYRQDVESRFRAMTPGYMSPSEVRRLDIQQRIAAERQQLSGRGATSSNTNQVDPETRKLAEIYSKRIVDGQMDFEKVPPQLRSSVESQVKDFYKNNPNYVPPAQPKTPQEVNQMLSGVLAPDRLRRASRWQNQRETNAGVAAGAAGEAAGIAARDAARKRPAPAAAPEAPTRDPGTGELLSTAVDLNSPAMSALNQPGDAPAQGNSLSQSPNQEAGINAPTAVPATTPAAVPATTPAAVPATTPAAVPAAVPAPAPAAGTPSGTTIAAAAGVGLAGLATSFLFGGKSASSETTGNASGMVSKFTGGFGNFFSNRGGGGARNNQSVGGKIQPITGKGSGVGALQHYEPMLNALNKIYTFLRRNVESDRKNRELENNYREELALEEEKRHKELLKALKILMSNIFSRSGTQTVLSNGENKKSKGLLAGLLSAGGNKAIDKGIKNVTREAIKGSVRAFFKNKSLTMAKKQIPFAILAGAGIAAYKWANGDFKSAAEDFATWLPVIGPIVETAKIPEQLNLIAEEIYKEQYGNEVVPDDVKAERMKVIKDEIADEIETMSPLPKEQTEGIFRTINGVAQVVKNVGTAVTGQGTTGMVNDIGLGAARVLRAAQKAVGLGFNELMKLDPSTPRLSVPTRARLSAPIQSEPSDADAAQRVLDMYRGHSQQPAPKPQKTSASGIGPMLAARNTEKSYVRSIYTSTYVV